MGQPITLEQLDSLESQTDGCELPEVSNGLAGPMSPSDAKHFYHEWRGPGRHSSEGKELARIKRSDSERGLERVGRYANSQMYVFIGLIHLPVKPKKFVVW